jgi:Domain of unknown function (DUF6089)
MKLIVRVLYLILFSQTISSVVFAQRWESGLGVGLMHYKGDLSPRLRPLDGRPGANLFVRFNKDRALSYSFHLDAGRLMANETKSGDKLQRLRGYSFKANVFDANARIEYNFMNFRVSEATYISNWTPYAYIGLGAMYRKIGEFKANVVANPIPTAYTDKKNWAIAIPFGVGFKKKWRGPWNYGAEFGSYKFFGLGDGIEKPRSAGISRYDFLDGVGRGVVNSADRLQTANRDLGDWYLYSRFYVSYVFYKVACPR